MPRSSGESRTSVSTLPLNLLPNNWPVLSPRWASPGFFALRGSCLHRGGPVDGRRNLGECQNPRRIHLNRQGVSSRQREDRRRQRSRAQQVLGCRRTREVDNRRQDGRDIGTGRGPHHVVRVELDLKRRGARDPRLVGKLLPTRGVAGRRVELVGHRRPQRQCRQRGKIARALDERDLPRGRTQVNRAVPDLLLRRSVNAPCLCCH